MPGKFDHWTPAYLFDRLKDKLYQKSHPLEPWLTPRATRMISDILKPDMAALEFGSGRSTLWIAALVGSLTSIEHDPEWHAKVQNGLAMKNLTNAVVLLRKEESYLEPVYDVPLDSLDFALIDGIRRDECAVECLPRMRPGGWLVIDDAHRYLPSMSRAPYARRKKDGAITSLWSRFLELTEGWHVIQTSNGVKDTWIYIRED